MNGLNRRRGVRPLAPGDPATGNGHLYGDKDAGEVVPVALEPTVAGTAGYRREDILSLMAQGLVRQLCLWGESGTVEVCRIRLRRVHYCHSQSVVTVGPTVIEKPPRTKNPDLFYTGT